MNSFEKRFKHIDVVLYSQLLDRTIHSFRYVKKNEPVDINEVLRPWENTSWDVTKIVCRGEVLYDAALDDAVAKIR